MNESLRLNDYMPKNLEQTLTLSPEVCPAKCTYMFMGRHVEVGFRHKRVMPIRQVDKHEIGLMMPGLDLTKLTEYDYARMTNEVRSFCEAVGIEPFATVRTPNQNCYSTSDILIDIPDNCFKQSNDQISIFTDINKLLEKIFDSDMFSKYKEV